MESIEKLYQRILGLESPWEVEKVSLESGSGEIIINLNYNSHVGICPECGKECRIYDKRNVRKWRHLDTCQYKTYLVASIPRINCPDHKIKSISVPWSRSNSHFSMLFESYAIELLQAMYNQTKTAELLRISFSQINTIMKSAVNRGLARREKEELQYLGIDEKSIKRGHHYLSIAYDLVRGKVLEVMKGRDKKSSQKLLRSVKSKNDCNNLQAVSMDMWKSYINASREVFPSVDIVHDKFHIIKYLNNGVDKTRKIENTKLYKQKDKSLRRTKYLFLKNPENMTEKQSLRFEELKKMNLKTSKAWQIKENFKGFYNVERINSGKFFFNAWYNDVINSGLKHMVNVAEILVRHFNGIITYVKHRITNSLAENINGRIQKIKTIAKGFRDFKNYRISIPFYPGKLDMIPHKIL